MSLIAAVLSGLAPALSESKAEMVSALKADARGRPERLRLRNAFVVGQVAVALAGHSHDGRVATNAGRDTSATQRAASISGGFDF
jgi:hypothetical protein